MEKKYVSLLLLCFLMGVLVKESTASFKSCYQGCFILCIITPNQSAISCPFKCLIDCIKPSFPIDFTHRDNDYFCKLGCASSLCTNFSTKEFPSIILSLSLSLSLSLPNSSIFFKLFTLYFGGSFLFVGEEKVDSCVDSCSQSCTKS